MTGHEPPRRRLPIDEATVFLTSGLALVVEIVAARMLAPVVGMSLYTWTAIIAVVLAGLSVGHWIGGHLASITSDRKRLSRQVAFSLFLAALTTLLSLLILPMVSDFLLSRSGVRIATIVPIATAAFLLPSLLVGIVSPMVTTMALSEPGADQGKVIGRMFALGAAGSIFGTLLAGFALISWIGSASSMIAVSVIYAVMGLVHVLRPTPVRDTGTLIALAFTVFLAATGSALAVSGAAEQCDRESRYYCLRLVDTSDYTGWPSQGLEIDRWLHSVRPMDGSENLFIRSHHFIDELAAIKYGITGPFSAFFIGGGGLTVPDLWRRERPGGTWVVAEIDPEVSAFADNHFGIDITEPLTVYHGDARNVLMDLDPGQQFDLIYNDAYQGLTMPAHLVTREFNRLVHRHLKDGGFYIVNLIDDGRYPQFLQAMVETLQLEFPVVEIWRDREELRDGRRVHFGLIAGTSATRLETIVARRGVERGWSQTTLEDLLAGRQVVEPVILTDDFAPVDRLMANYCSLQFLRHIGIEIGRPEFC